MTNASSEVINNEADIGDQGQHEAASVLALSGSRYTNSSSNCLSTITIIGTTIGAGDKTKATACVIRQEGQQQDTTIRIHGLAAYRFVSAVSDYAVIYDKCKQRGDQQ